MTSARWGGDHVARSACCHTISGTALRAFSESELGGWKSLTMVARYAHLSPEQGRSAIERLVTRRPNSQPGPVARAE